jgi:hypothetical protein
MNVFHVLSNVNLKTIKSEQLWKWDGQLTLSLAKAAEIL